MLPGPVFTFEMLTTARRGRFYMMRAFYAAVLFVILWSVYSVWAADMGGELPRVMVKWFTLSTYGGITIGQEILVLLLTPALVATAITDEKQRKTLHYLLASQLTGPEIVLGKLGVRMLYMSVLIGVSLPILSLMVLLGGIDPRFVLLAFARDIQYGVVSGGSLDLGFDDQPSRARGALCRVWTRGTVVLFAADLQKPSLLGWQPLDQAVHWLGEWISPSSPISVAIALFFSAVGGGGTRGSELELIGWMVGLQTAFGVALAALASWQLRPIFRRQDGGTQIRALNGLRSFFLRGAASGCGAARL